MKLDEIVNLILPPTGGFHAHITAPSGDYGDGEAQGRRHPSTFPHGGVDMNYIGGQTAKINQNHPAVHSPVPGTVTKVGAIRSYIRQTCELCLLSNSACARFRDCLRVAVKMLSHAPACLVWLVAVALSGSASAANDVPIGLRTVWSFDQEGTARFCYDKTPAVIYPKYDVARKMTSILKRELGGEEHVVGEFPGSPDPRSLSCSQDGQTIVARGIIGVEQQASLFLSQGTRTSIYLFPGAWMFSNVGLYSLLSPDGKSITLPEKPSLVAGPDLLKEMRIVPYAGHKIFFMKGYAYSDVGDKINKYGYANGEWKVQQEIKLPRNFGLSEVATCGDHDVATLVGFDSARFAVLDEAPVSKKDWLERIGVRKLFRKYSDPVLITGTYGACAFPLRGRALQMGAANGLARFDANGLQLFAFPNPEFRLGDEEVNFSKDGCYVLIPAPTATLLAVQSPRCQ